MIITIFMKGAPRSEQFDDIYFSVENGLEETAHVFLQGNNLPDAWVAKDNFVIAETGFGTGLNFLSAWKLFEETSKPLQRLDFISIEKYPLTPEVIKEALKPWQEYFGERIDSFLSQYPIRVAGFHRIQINSQITLTLIFDDIHEALPELDAAVDCWFLDGFTPAKNPDMWSEAVFEQMARLSKASASYATFTALAHGTRIAIIGAGLAGTSCAYVLKQYGYNPVIYEASDKIAAGASGNNLGLYNPRFTAQRDEISGFYVPAYAQIIRLGQKAGDVVDYNPTGALHLINKEEKAKRFSYYVLIMRKILMCI